ncbi:MAG TPA: hypothetical protein H9894_05925 [Candidatus Desulfovibrio intestinipullorum]|uniref:Uncharacterized protein n=1 Tax=Candidatus Desulfovibrio intestinipullorum TaxID=2838536 RepID=A0A9D1TQ38_9BACT|nr:hypothetical protein [Candidatus Desulfovibrio intestinipullorum]
MLHTALSRCLGLVLFALKAARKIMQSMQARHEKKLFHILDLAYTVATTKEGRVRLFSMYALSRELS